MGTPYYIDTSTIGNEYQAYTDVPTTWAVPQDGNGKASSAAASAVPLCELTFTAVPTSGAISVYGVTITLTGVLSAASTSVAATALASSINATVSTLNSTVSAMLLPLNRFVYARVKPGESTVVQIMSRFAGADLNYPALASARVVNTFNLSAVTSPLDFTGGTDGPWAYTFNTASAFGKAALAYGLYFAVSPTPAIPLVTDYIVVRTKRGASLSTNFTSGSAFNATWQSRTYVYDNGAVWAGDNGTYTASFKYTGFSSVACALTVGSSAQLCHAPVAEGGFKIEGGNTLSGSGSVLLLGFAGASAKIIARNCTIEEVVDSNNVVSSMIVSGNAGTVVTMYADFSGSTIRFRSTAKKLWNSAGSVDGGTPLYSQRVVLNGVKMEVIAATGPIGTFVSMLGAGSLLYMEWHGGYVKDTNNTYTCATPFSTFNKGVVSVIDNVSGITNPSVGYVASINDTSQFVWYQSEGDRPGYRFECPQYAVDWIGDGTFPYTGVARDQHGRQWSHRVAWNSAPSLYMAVTPAKFAYTYRDTPAIKTFTLQLYVPDSTTIYIDEFEAELIYVDSDGVGRRDLFGGARHHQLGASRTAISSSAAVWTPNGLANHSAKKIEITTSYPVKTNSEVNLRWSFCVARTPTVSLYFSPELEVS